jgi:uncharacterized protein
MRYAAVPLVLLVWSASAFAAAPYINCAAARTADERAICRSTTLVQLDAEMSTLYRITKGLVAMGQRGEIQDDQSEWLQERRACRASFSCLRATYVERIRQLDEVIDRIREGGPY